MIRSIPALATKSTPELPRSEKGPPISVGHLIMARPGLWADKVAMFMQWPGRMSAWGQILPKPGEPWLRKAKTANYGLSRCSRLHTSTVTPARFATLQTDLLFTAKPSDVRKAAAH
jgi:hypothetical protein